MNKCRGKAGERESLFIEPHQGPSNVELHLRDGVRIAFNPKLVEEHTDSPRRSRRLRIDHNLAVVARTTTTWQ